jgi:hypothetical protein
MGGEIVCLPAETETTGYAGPVPARFSVFGNFPLAIEHLSTLTRGVHRELLQKNS